MAPRTAPPSRRPASTRSARPAATSTAPRATRSWSRRRGGAGFNVGNVGGDGWEALFIDANVYDVDHHSSPPATTTVDCHDKVTGAACPGFAGGGTYASEVAGQPLGTGANTLVTSDIEGAVAVQATGRLFYPAGRFNTTSIGVACMDLRALVSCGYTELNATAPFPNTAPRAQIVGGRVDRLAVLPRRRRRSHLLLRYRHAGRVPGPGRAARPARVGHTRVIASEVEVFDGRRVWLNLALGTSARALLCLDTTTGNACAGAFPILNTGAVTNFGAFVFNVPLAPILSPTGALTGICAEDAPNLASTAWLCFDLAGNATGAAPWPQRVPNTAVHWRTDGSVGVVGTKLYFAQTDGLLLDEPESLPDAV